MKLSFVKSVEERQTERAEVENIRAEAGKANSIVALKKEVERLAEIVEKILART